MPPSPSPSSSPNPLPCPASQRTKTTKHHGPPRKDGPQDKPLEIDWWCFSYSTAGAWGEAGTILPLACLKRFVKQWPHFNRKWLQKYCLIDWRFGWMETSLMWYLATEIFGEWQKRRETKARKAAEQENTTSGITLESSKWHESAKWLDNRHDEGTRGFLMIEILFD